MTKDLLYFLLIVCVYIVYSEPITNDNVLTYLKTYGYIQCRDDVCSNIVLSDALRDYQDRTGLPVTGLLDKETKTSMERPRCGVQEKPVIKNGSLGGLPLGHKWRKKKIKWSFLGPAPSKIGPEKTIKILTEAFKRWADITPLKFIQVFDERESDIPIDFDYIDGMFLSASTIYHYPFLF